MLNSTAHWQPLVNGYSDYIPGDFRLMARKLARFPAPESFEAMRRRDVRYIVIHVNRFTPEHLADARQALAGYGDHLRVLASDDRVQVFEVLSWPE
jgi:hypothetical protein